MCGYIQAHITERETTYLQLEALTHALRRSRDRRRKVTEKRQRRNGIHGNGSRAPTRKASGSVAPSGRLSATTGRGRAYASGGDVEDQEDSPSTFSALASHRVQDTKVSRPRATKRKRGCAVEAGGRRASCQTGRAWVVYKVSVHRYRYPHPYPLRPDQQGGHQLERDGEEVE